MSFYRKLLEIYSFSFFRDFVREEGIFLVLLLYFFMSFILFLISPVLILGFPFLYFNEKSKKWFK